jgi:uncharacterized protein
MRAKLNRRNFIGAISALCIAASSSAKLHAAVSTKATGQRLANAALEQIGVTLSYDPGWTHINYPNGDVPRATGVCADVVVRAARDGLSLDLQMLVHEDMMKDFDAYPAHKTWGTHRPDTNIDHRRVLNLEAYWTRARARLWAAPSPTPGDAFPAPIEVGDIVTWLLDGRLPHVGIIVSSAPQVTVVHNIGRGVEQSPLAELHRAAAHYRWPTRS